MSDFIPDKPFLDYAEMIELLISRNLIISTDEIPFTIHSLQTYSYYDLVNGNVEKLLKPDLENEFIDGISIKLLVRIKVIEEQLRSTFLSQILAIEKSFCTKLSWYIAKEFGVDSGPGGYLRKSNYSSSQKSLVTSTMKRLRGVLKSTVPNRKASSSLEFYQKQHNHVPPWILVNDLMFGEAINWYKCLYEQGKNVLSEDLFIFPILDRELRLSLLVQCLDIIREYRNFLAHNSALSKMKSNRKLNKLELSKILNDHYINDDENSNNLYACFISILLLSTNMDQLKFFLLSLEKIFSTVDIDEQKIIFENTFGLPNNILSLAEEIIKQKMI